MSAGNVKKTSQRNGKIELLRFIFCIGVLLFHCEKYVLGEPSLEKGYHLSLFCHGSMGVEFFFLVSGFLMAKSISKKIRMQTELQETLAKESLGFLKRKIASIFPMHVMIFILAQLTPIYFICEFGKEWPAKKQIAGIVVGTFLLAYLVFGADYLLHYRKGRKQA